MDVGYLSPTKLKQIRLCEARLYAKLNQEIEDESGEGALAGTLAHEAAELWFSPKHRAEGYSPDEDTCFGHAIQRCSQDSYKGLPRMPESIAEARRLFGNIVAFYNRDAIKVIFTERSYKGTLAGGVPVSLRIDLGIDEGNGLLRVIDFKTGFITMSADDMANEDQVLMNLMAVMRDEGLKDYPHKEFVYFWARFRYASKEVSISPETLAHYELALGAEYQRVLDVTEETMRETPNPYCVTCGRRTSCKAFRELVGEVMGGGHDYSDEALKALSLDDLLARLVFLNGQGKANEKYTDAVKGWVDTLMGTGGIEKVEGERFKASMIRQRRHDYHAETILSIAQQRGIPVLELFSVNTAAVKRMLTHPDDIERIEKSMITSFNKPWVKVSAVGQKKTKAKSAGAAEGEDES